MSDFIAVEAVLENKEGNVSTFSADTDVTLFNEKLDGDDLIVYDIDKAIAKLDESGKDYADYATLKASSVPASTIETLDDKDGFNTT